MNGTTMQGVPGKSVPGERDRNAQGRGCLKALLGFLLLVALVFGYGTFLARSASSRQVLESLFRGTVEAALKERGFRDDARTLATLKRLFERSGKDVVRPVPGLSFTLRRKDIAGLQPGQLSRVLAARMVDSFYGQSVQAFLKDIRAKDGSSVNLPAWLGKMSLADVHRSLNDWFLRAAVAAAVLLLGMVLLSRGPQRLLGPGIIITVSALPPFLLSLGLRWGLGNLLDSSHLEKESARLAYRQLVEPAIGMVQQTLLWPVLVGLVLVVSALVIRSMEKKRRLPGA